MKKILLLLLLLAASLRLLSEPPSEFPLQASAPLPQNFPAVSFTPAAGAFPLVASGSVADIVTDQRDFPVASIAAGHLVDGACPTSDGADASQHASGAPRMTRVPGLGYTDGLVALPFDTPSYGWPDASSLSASGAQQPPLTDATYSEFELSLEPSDSLLEVRTLPTLHVYEGRDARFAVQLGDHAPLVFSIHADDFSAEWRRNVLRGFAARRIALPADLRRRLPFRLPCRVYLLDPGIILQELLVY